MSWIERIKNELTITCGDGKQFTPNYLNPKKSIKYNLAQFNFPNIAGTLVKRKAPQGTVFPVEFYFQGEEHLETAKAFEESARDPRPWKLSHPYYGDLIVQPASLEFDNAQHNVTKVSGTVLETTEKVRPTAVESPVEKVMNAKVETDAIVAEAYANTVVPISSDIIEMELQNETLFAQAQALSTGDIGAEYFNAFNTASSAIAQATNAPLAAMRRIQSMITAPSLFAASVRDRINLLTSQFETMVATVANLTTPNQKRQFQAAGGTMMTTMAQAAVNGNYATTTDALGVMASIADNFNSYIVSIDQLQTVNASTPESYVPDLNAIMAVENLTNTAISNLFNIALNSQQERFVFIPYDSNPVILTHQFYGLDNADENLQRFIETNNLGLNELINITAGTRIVYYV